jgi:hypothetical protein
LRRQRLRASVKSVAGVRQRRIRNSRYRRIRLPEAAPIYVSAGAITSLINSSAISGGCSSVLCTGHVLTTRSMAA